MRETCRALVERVRHTGRCDFISDFALRLPTKVFLGFIGLDTADADRFVACVPVRGLRFRLQR